jgi:hypothetical protein
MKLYEIVSHGLIIVTGPLDSGKSTYKRNLCKKANTECLTEYQTTDIDITNSGWWKPLQKYAGKSTVVETHLYYEGEIPGDKKIIAAKVKKPPEGVEVHFMLPSVKTLWNRQKNGYDEKVDISNSQADLDGYTSIYEALKSKGTKVQIVK